MRTSLLMLLWLAAVAPVAHAADWLSWRKVGDASLTWGPFTVYTSQLSTPDGRYHGPEQDQALIITYKRDIDRDQLGGINGKRPPCQAGITHFAPA